MINDDPRILTDMEAQQHLARSYDFGSTEAILAFLEDRQARTEREAAMVLLHTETVRELATLLQGAREGRTQWAASANKLAEAIRAKPGILPEAEREALASYDALVARDNQ